MSDTKIPLKLTSQGQSSSPQKQTILQATLISIQGKDGCCGVYVDSPSNKKSSKDSKNNHQENLLFAITAKQVKLIEAVDALELPPEVKIRLRLKDIQCDDTEIATYWSFKSHNCYLEKIELICEGDEASYLRPLSEALGQCGVLSLLKDNNEATKILSVGCLNLNFNNIGQLNDFYAEKRKKVEESLFYIKNSYQAHFSLMILGFALTFFCPRHNRNHINIKKYSGKKSLIT